MTAAALALLPLALLLEAPAGAGVFSPARNCSPSLHPEDYDGGGLWLALKGAEACASVPGLTSSRKAQALRDEGAIRALLGDEAGAERDLREALKLEPAEGDALLRLAALLREKPEEALAFAEKASRAAPSPLRRAAALRLAGEIRFDLGDAAGARAAFAEVLAIDAADLDSLCALARVEKAIPERARSWAEKAERSARAQPLWRRREALRLCSELWRDLGDAGRALGCLGADLDLDPYDFDALKAALELRRSSPEAAEGFLPRAAPSRAAEPPADEKAALRALEAEPEDPEALRAVIALRLAQNRPADARTLASRFMDTLDEAPSWQQAGGFRFIHQAWKALGDERRAHQSAIHVNNRDLEAGTAQGADACVDVARARGELGDPAGYEAALKHALELEPSHRRALSELAELELERAPSAALAYSDRLLAAARDAQPWEKADVLRQRARIQEALHDLEGAETSLLKAAEWRGDPRQARLDLALLDAEGRPERARAYAERLIKESTAAPTASRAEAWQQRARILLALKDDAGAVEALEKALELEPGSREALSDLARLELERSPARALALNERLLQASAQAAPAEQASAWRQRAQILLALKDEAGAEQSLRRAAALEPGSREALSGLVRLELERRPKDALADSQRLLEAAKKAPAAERAGILWQRSQIQLALKDGPGAEAALKEALALEPGHARALSNLAQLELGHSPKEALAESDRLIQASSGADAAAWRQRAQIQIALQDPAGAEASLLKAVNLDSADLKALPPLISVELALGRPERARDFADRRVREAPAAEHAAALRGRALVREQLRDENGALGDYALALDAEPGDLLSLWKLADARRNRPREALALIEARRPDEAGLRPAWLELRGLLHSDAGDEKGARKDFAAALSAEPSLCFAEAPPRERLASAFLTACLERFPAQARLYSDRGVAFYVEGRRAEAEADFRKAVALEPGLLEARLSLVSALADQGRRAEAIQEADKALALDGGREKAAYLRLTELRASLKENEK